MEAIGFGLLHVDQTQKIYKLKSGNAASFNMDRIPEEDCESIYYRGLSEIEESEEEFLEEGTLEESEYEELYGGDYEFGGY